MANLPESSTFDAGVYQLETTDPVVGGASGVSNTPLKNLANRTKYLKDHIDALEAGTTIPPTVAPLNSPAFTGTPTAPNQSAGDSSAKLATTAFVQTAVGGFLSKSVAGSANVTLTAVEAGNAILEFTGTLTGNIAVIVPNAPTRTWVVRNATTGAFTLTVKTAAGSGIPILQGAQSQVYSDGTNVLLTRTDFNNVSLTGAPTAPTAAPGTNTTQVATTAFVAAAVATVAAPVTSVAGKTGVVTLAVADVSGAAPLASPALTGSPTAPTAVVNTNSTQLATTAFVLGQAGTATPAAPGAAAAVGTATRFAREDHVHIRPTYADVGSPSTTGLNASGTWGISITGTAGGVAWGNVSGRPTSLSSFTNDPGFITGGGRAYPRRADGVEINFNWSGQAGQPTWLWGGTDGSNMYVYNPANFSVSYAASAGNADTVDGYHASAFLQSGSGSHSWVLVWSGNQTAAINLRSNFGDGVYYLQSSTYPTTTPIRITDGKGVNPGTNGNYVIAADITDFGGYAYQQIYKLVRS